MRPLGVALTIIAFILLTALTQIGGILYLLSRLAHKPIDRFISKTYQRRIAKTAAFIAFYLVGTFLLIPFIAPVSGRVRLPVNEQHHIKPLSFITVLLNRNYVKPALRDAAFVTGDEMNRLFPGTTINYLDGCFPFINKFPLLPHLSHNDGNKLDLAFCYKDAATGDESNNHPSLIGYGVCEEALAGEKNILSFVNRTGIFNTAF